MPLRINRITRPIALLLLFASVAPGCGSQNGRFNATIVGYNHTSIPIAEFTLKVDQGDAVSGMSLLEHSGGGGFVCCVEVPRKWHNNMNITVNITELVDGMERERVVMAPVPKYDSDNMNILNIHFLRGGHVKIFLYGATANSKNYPLQGEEAELGGPD
ncbi:DUF3304 domain-containing protein [Massilia sp. PAMC28688]|uniref:DUF3304 domain-containing protein n=1 Tax=Massilia sp. PAMC28688 TaxID=2861283 RepID=UPI001C634063|nr:DUF3304 domain-containing protein [Massilia sp. PAMC28688]QYF92764.1 DUF3304 domain-containing protein [Massilia sp. PAMC28688]